MVVENLYLIAIIPPESIREDIQKFKEDFRQRFFSETASKVITHITLKTPFKLPFEKAEELKKWFERLYVGVEPFEIELKNFGAFHNPEHPVIYVNPSMTTQLYSLQNEIIRSFHVIYPQIKILDIEHKFKPHVTVAYRDLSPEAFHKAWSEYQSKKYYAVFPVENFYLLQHDTRKWNIVATHGLQRR